YDREMALVAELEASSGRQLIGVGRLVAAADRRTAELALLVVDEWQGQGLGERLTDACLEIATDWGVDSITAETTPANARMLAILQSRGFELTSSLAECRVLARKAMPPEETP
ncbi:MAG: GCN5-related N-acetyltransferase, partial [Armatimonadetes bacterium]|nr:GCN5-related N-acetyltransferase [Armatimonadota bacterium]